MEKENYQDVIEGLLVLKELLFDTSSSLNGLIDTAGDKDDAFFENLFKISDYSLNGSQLSGSKRSREGKLMI